MKALQVYSLAVFKGDFAASIVVVLVALPLALGIATASGFPPSAGLITGVIGGLVVGLFSGAPLQVSGAAAGLTVVVAEGVQQFGLPAMATVITLGGILQLLMAVFHLGGWFKLVSPTVMYSMLAGIGLLIVVGQGKSLLSAEGTAMVPALAMGLGVMGVMWLWGKISPLSSIFHHLPASLVAIMGAAVMAYAFELPVSYISLPENLLADLSWELPSWTLVREHPAIVVAAIQLALIASAESLLCAAALDHLHTGARTRFNRELAAQGLGNVLCGIMGALPLTGVIVRSSANIHGGAKTRGATMMHGLWLGLILLAFPDLLSLVPQAALAGLLIATGIKLMVNKFFLTLYHQRRMDLLVVASTVGVILTVDLLTGVVVGIAVEVFLRQLKGRLATRAADVG